jgi:predicted dehydrogenase
VAFDVRDPFEAELDDFVRAVEEGRDPEVNGEEGTRNTELLEQAAPVSLGEPGRGSPTPSDADPSRFSP